MWLRWPGLLSLRLLSIMTWGFTPCWTSLWSNLPAPLTPHSILLFHRRKTSVPVTPPLWLVQTDYPGFEGGSSISPALPSAASLANTDWSKHLTHCSDLSSKPRKTFYAVYLKKKKKVVKRMNEHRAQRGGLWLELLQQTWELEGNKHIMEENPP